MFILNKPHSETPKNFPAKSNKGNVQIENLGSEINSPGVDYAPCISADGKTLFFVSDKKGSTLNDNNEASHDIWKAEINNINGKVRYKSELIDKNSPNTNSGINTKMNEGVCSFTLKDTTIFFTACDRPDGLGNCDIYMSRCKNGKWSKAVNLGPEINSEYWDTQPTVTQDKNRLYFLSNRPVPSRSEIKGKDNFDIWYSDWDYVLNQWGQAENLTQINTAGKEFCPFISADGTTLYFSSDSYLPNYGGLDFYKSEYNPVLKKWYAPINLGMPINTEKDEMFLSIPSSGDVIYFSSKRDDIPGKIGNIDIYRAFKKNYQIVKSKKD